MNILKKYLTIMLLLGLTCPATACNSSSSSEDEVPPHLKPENPEEPVRDYYPKTDGATRLVTYNVGNAETAHHRRSRGGISPFRPDGAVPAVHFPTGWSLQRPVAAGFSGRPAGAFCAGRETARQPSGRQQRNDRMPQSPPDGNFPTAAPGIWRKPLALRRGRIFCQSQRPDCSARRKSFDPRPSQRVAAPETSRFPLRRPFRTAAGAISGAWPTGSGHGGPRAGLKSPTGNASDAPNDPGRASSRGPAGFPARGMYLSIDGLNRKLV